jgi:hypothetical protein
MRPLSAEELIVAQRIGQKFVDYFGKLMEEENVMDIEIIIVILSSVSAHYLGGISEEDRLNITLDFFDYTAKNIDIAVETGNVAGVDRMSRQ